MFPDLSVQAGLSLEAHVAGLNRRLDDREKQVRELAESVSAPEAPGISFTGASAAGGLMGAYAPPQWGPTLGYIWAVQIITVGPLGTGDTLAIYRGLTSSDNNPQRLKYQFSGANGAWQTWSPGRTGLVLHGGREGLVFDPGSGTLTSATRYFVNIDVIQIEDKNFPYFLL
jgi:hypothetical protein